MYGEAITLHAALRPNQPLHPTQDRSQDSRPRAGERRRWPVITIFIAIFRKNPQTGMIET
jgi:hypothetical protein